MAKTIPQKRKRNTDPFLAAAFFAEKVLREEDGVLSVIRIIDRITRRFGPESGPKEENAPYNLNLLLMVKSGGFKGKRDLVLHHELPGGSRSKIGAFPLVFEGVGRGNTVHLSLRFAPTPEGTHWFEIHLGRKWLMRVPLEVHHIHTQKPGSKKGKSGTPQP